jgi:hypothetical protein
MQNVFMLPISMLPMPMHPCIHASKETYQTSLRTDLLQLHKCIKLLQPTLTKDLFREPLRALTRSETHSQSF